MPKKSKAQRPAQRPGTEPSLKDQIAASGETEMDPLRRALSEEQVDQKFLGREFLTWILYYADDENGAGAFTSDETDAFKIQPGERVVLRAMGDGAGEIAARGAAPAQMADVRYSIAGGLTVRETELFILRGDRTWQFTVNAELFDLKRVKLPALLGENDLERVEERLGLLDDLDNMLQVAYFAFLRERLLPGWDTKQVPRIRAWLARSILEKEQLAVEIGKEQPEAGKRPTPTHMN